jgi:allophanate hydrolase subunit 2
MMLGARVYVSVRGGIINSGDAMHAGPDPQTPAALQPAARHEPSTNVRFWPGPRLDWFDDDALQILTSSSFVVTDTSRVGSRLTGGRLRRVRHDELPSEGMVEGAMQVPPDGNPIVMLAGYPATGGYPVIAVVDPADVHLVAQAAVGTELRFRPA